MINKKQLPKRLYTKEHMYTILENYEFTTNGVKFYGHKGYNLVGRKKAENINVDLGDIKWFEYSVLENVRSMHSINVELQNHIYCKWFALYGGIAKDTKDYVVWSEHYRKERDSILRK